MAPPTGANRLDLSYARNANGQLTGVTDSISSGRGASFTYTDSGRLATANGPWGDDTYTYDAAGGRLDKARQIGLTTTHETAVVASASNRVDTVQDGSSATIRTLTWRAGGDLSQAVAGGVTFDYQYNARKRLARLQVGGVTRADYGYDFRGQRVWRQVFGATALHFHYVFDREGHLLAVHDGATGAALLEYIWLEDKLVAAIDSSGGSVTTYFVHTGQLDEPLVMTDATKSTVWDAYVEPYGAANYFSASVGLSLRLPGQWEEFESGFSQNWHRNYDPSLGRYIQTDPLGIEAGQNPYVYVEGDPLNEVDPSGLIVRVVAKNPKEARRLMNAYARLNQTKRGREITSVLERDCVVYEIRPIKHDAFYCPPGAGGKCTGYPYTVFVDPNSRLLLPTTKGSQPTPLEVLLAHELGHAGPKGINDVNSPEGKKMRNVAANENPVRRSLGVPERTQYFVPAPGPVWVKPK